MNVPVLEKTVIEQSAYPELSGGRVAIGSAGVLLGALAIARCIYLTQAHWQGEKGVLLTGAIFAVFLVVTLGAYLLKGNPRPATAGLMFLTTTAVLLLATYLFWVSWYIFFPADFLIWSESDFVNDILKLLRGYPLYSPQVNNDSFFYVPGTQLLTYLLARLTGLGRSVAAFRMIQVVYIASAALIGVLCCRRILRIAWPELNAVNSPLWNAFWYATLFLISTNSITSPFSHNLHGDALAQLAALTGYYLLLCYCETRSCVPLAGMAVFAPAGFLIRQSLVVWGGLFVGFLAVWDRRWKRLAAFTAAAAVLMGLVLAACRAIWGEPFFYWTVYVLGEHGVSPLRSFQHALTAWPYLAIGLLGGAAALRRGETQTSPQANALRGAWVVWIAVIATETYTSGIAWMLNHIGPGSSIAGVWFMVGLASVWERASETWVRSAALTASVALGLSGLGVIRIPVQAIPDDAYRYVRDIEQEFDGVSPNKVLLDAGTWVYMRDGVIMGDRAPSIGERGFKAVADLSGILTRIADKHYTKILVRGFHDPDFVYDYYLWPKPSGIRQALQNNYRESRTIRAVADYPQSKNWAEDPYYFGQISILEPKTGPIGK